MFKDYYKYISKSIQVYLFVLVLVFILKIVGFDYFGLDIENPTMLKINDYALKIRLDIVYSYIVCFISSYIVVSVSINDNSKKLLKFMTIIFPITLLVKYSGYFLNVPLYYLLQLIYLIVVIIIYQKKLDKKSIFNYFKVSIIILLFQLASTVFRNQNFDYTHYNFIVAFIMNVDQLLLSILYYKMYFMKGGKQCYQEVEVGSFSQKKQNLKKLPKKLQKNYQSNLKQYKGKTKEEKITFIIYFTLSLIWNIFSVLVVLFVSKINGTLIECIFILTSFWLSKGKFGKPFHFDSMLVCFAVSNISYYILNRLTTNIGISIFIPILLGVGLSYVTSKFVKKTYKPLYRGMPEDLFNDTILNVVDKDSTKYNICYDSYIMKETDVSLSFKYSYTVYGIRKIKDRINKKIKELNN